MPVRKIRIGQEPIVQTGGKQDRSGGKIVKITMNRGSVCLYDDMSSHEKTFVVADDMRFSGLMELIFASDYLPPIAGNDVVWCLENGSEELLSYVTKSHRIFTRWGEDDLFVRDRADNNYYFRYYASPKKRAEYLLAAYCDKLDFVHCASYGEEYLHYNAGERREDRPDMVFFHTACNDIRKYRSKVFPAFWLSHKDKEGSLLLKEASCVLTYDLDKQAHQYEIPYANIKSISAKSITYKGKFRCTAFTISLHPTQQQGRMGENLFSAMRRGSKGKGKYTLYSSVCESRDERLCSLEIAMAVLKKRLKEKTQ